MDASQLTWGDTVVIKDNAPPKYNPSQLGSICGIRKIETPKESQQFNCPKGKIIYLIELSNGYSVEIPDTFLIKRAGS